MPRLLAHAKKSQNQSVNPRKGIVSVYIALLRLARQFSPLKKRFWGNKLKSNLVPRLLAHVEKCLLNLIPNCENTPYLSLTSK